MNGTVKYFNILDKTTYGLSSIKSHCSQTKNYSFPKQWLLRHQANSQEEEYAENTQYIQQGEAIQKAPNPLKRII